MPLDFFQKAHSIDATLGAGSPSDVSESAGAILQPPGHKPTAHTPLLRKIAHAIIPPFNMHLNPWNEGSGPSASETAAQIALDLSQISAAEANDDDVDIARPVGEQVPSDYLFNMLTTALVFSDNERKDPRVPPNARKPSTLYRLPLVALPIPPPEDHDGTASVSSASSTESEGSELDSGAASFKPGTSIDELLQGLGGQLDEIYRQEVENTEREIADSVSQRKSIATSTSASTLLESDQFIPQEKRTPFQQSVVQKLNPHLFHEGVLITHKEEASRPDTSDPQYQLKKENLRLKIADKLKQVFELSDDDCFYANFDTWMVRDVLLQGHLYLTRESICFFAFLPKRYTVQEPNSSRVASHDDSYFFIQSGSLGMKTAQYGDSYFSSMITHRFWAVLRLETLTIYSSPTDLYFPILVIDLKSALGAEILDKPAVASPAATLSPRSMSRRNSNDSKLSLLPSLARKDSVESPDEESDISSVLSQEVEDTENSSGGAWFKIVTKKKTYKFHTDNSFSARQWCNNLTKIIFQLHNSNSRNEVLLKIPIEKVISLERKTVFSSPDDVEEIGLSEEVPLFFNVKHIETNDHEDQLLRMKRKFHKNGKVYVAPEQPGAAVNSELSSKLAEEGTHTNVEINDTYFLFFNAGDEFYKAFNQIIYDKAASSSGGSDDHKSIRSDTSVPFSEKAKRVIRRNEPSFTRSNPQLTGLPKTISTLTKANYTSRIVTQILLANEHLKSENDAIDNAFLHNNNLQPTKPVVTGQVSKLKKIATTLSPFKKTHNTSEHSLIVGKDIDKPNTEVEHVEMPSHSSSKIALPKELSISGLKNLNMSFETSQKNLEVAECRYSDSLDNIGQMSSDLYTLKADGLDPAQVNAQRAYQASLSTPLNLSDPSEYRNDQRAKKRGLKLWAKNIKAITHVSNILSPNPSHYRTVLKDDPYFVTDETTQEVSSRHFREHFSLNNERYLIASYYCHLQRSLPVYGKLYLGNDELCFRSLLPGVSTRMILPLKDIETCTKEKGMNLAYSGLVLSVKGHEELFLEFSSQKALEDCIMMILQQLERIHGNETWEPKPYEWGINHAIGVSRTRNRSFSTTQESRISAGALNTKMASTRIENARLKLFEDKINTAIGLDVPIILEDSPFFKMEIKPSTSFNITLLTIGSRGDVQPYIALGKGLMAEGHKVTIATHDEFKPWILKHKMNFSEIAGDPAELMSLMVSHGSLSVAFFKEASSKFRGWINELLRTSWEACQGADILIESPSAMAGVHVAEALGIPYMRAFTMPWTRTRAYPHAFIVPDQKKGGSYNYLTHVMFENVFWKGISSQVNRWRVEDLELPRTNLFKLQQSKIPFLYNVSSSIFPPSVDFPDWIKVTGYWFLDEGAAEDYNPPEELVAFMKQAQEDNKKLVYIGFGSIVVDNAKVLTEAIVEAVLDADVRCILNKGWSDRLLEHKDGIEIELPAEIYNSGAVPHDWLFPQIHAAVHHGGSGTTGATLRAGLPTIIKPFFGDQFFYASRVETIGVGISLKKLNAKSLAKALVTATSDAKMIEKAQKTRLKIEQENGVMAAVETIYSELEYARNLIALKQQQNEQAKNLDYKSGTQTPVVYEEDEEGLSRDELSEESSFEDSDEDTDRE